MFGFLKKKSEGDSPPPNHQLTDITRGMYHAAATTNAMLAKNFLYLLEKYFEKSETEDIYYPVTRRIAITDDTTIDVPLISLVTPKSLSLEKMIVDLSIKIDELSLKKVFDQIDDEFKKASPTRSSFTVQMSPKTAKDGRASDIIDIRMEFKASDPPEGIMRLIDQYTKMVAPPVKPAPETEVGDKETETGETGSTQDDKPEPEGPDDTAGNKDSGKE